jgi:hypothetical protein
MNMPRMQGDEVIKNIKDLYEESGGNLKYSLLTRSTLFLQPFWTWVSVADLKDKATS